MNIPKKVTIWRKEVRDYENSECMEDRKYKFIHNHIENDWIEGDKPKPINKTFKQQNDWQTDNWKKIFTYLTDGKVSIKRGE